METKLYQIKAGFAKHNKLPVYFVANQLMETKRAVYLYGRGTTETKKIGRCCKCGRELTHPVSVELGIGPECGKHYWDWDAVGGYTEDNVERLAKLVQQDIKIDSWVPKSVITEAQPTEDAVETPADHKLAKGNKTKGKKSVNQKVAKEVRYQKSGKRAIKILFPFDRQTLARVKTIPGRKYHGKDYPKYWTAPVSVEAVEKLKEFGFELDQSLLDYLDDHKVNISDMTADVDIPGLGGTLFPFQAKGVSFLEARDGRALIADEMGLGKTVQALAWLQKHPAKRPAIIVCPASLKINWKREAEKWMSNPDIQLLNGRKPTQPIIGDVLIINYDILQYWADKLSNIKAQVIVLDESHYIKNNKAKRTKAAKKIAKGIPHVITLTGTPIVNRPIEVLNAIQLVDKSVAPNRWHFLHRYCDAKHNGFGWDFTGASNTQELHEKLTNTIMIRRLKKDVLKDLPDKMRSFVPIEMDNRKEYHEAEMDFINYVKNKTQRDAEIELREAVGESWFKDAVEFKDHKLERLKEQKAAQANAGGVLVKIEILKQLAVQGKLKQSINWIRDFLESGEKLVVMAVHKFVINRLMEEFGDIAVKVDGSVTGEARDSAVQRFQKDRKVKLFVGNVQAAGVGLTLTAASTVAFLELPWTPGELAQAEDRVHRIGQKDAVNIYYLLAEDTIEERIAHLIDKKRKVLDSVLDGKEPDEESLISELMEQYRQAA